MRVARLTDFNSCHAHVANSCPSFCQCGKPQDQNGRHDITLPCEIEDEVIAIYSINLNTIS